MIAPTGDTLGATAATLDLKSGHRTHVSLVARSDQSRITICAPILARTPLLVPNSLPDTLWVASWGPVAANQEVPIC